GRGTAIGALSVPPSWDAIAPATSPLSATLGETPLAAPPAVAAGMPGMPFANAAGSHSSGDAPRYGFRPTVVIRPLAAG
ncbi:PE/PPE C-terminal domain-containing protein, partial [Mycobacterium sp.]|uniref:PE/PPE C-terminal domain-containing protein n=1 Tax=Mycobacterium sp. TaxID=1785 RepID=UPI003BB03D66